jgi:hypothetical protein
MRKIGLNWDYIELAINNLAWEIQNSGHKIRAIKGLQRGGLIPAVMLSHKLNIPMIKDSQVLDNTILIVDDICDSGVTLKPYIVYYKCLTATIHYKPSAIVKPSFYYEETKDNEWQVYPWEMLEAETVQDYLKLI